MNKKILKFFQIPGTLFLVIFAFLLPSQIRAQDPDINVAGNATFTQEFVIGTAPLTLTIDPLGAWDAMVFWAITSSPAPVPDPPNTGTTINGITVTIPGPPTTAVPKTLSATIVINSPTTAGTFTFRITLSDVTHGPQEREYVIKIRKPLDVMLVLDNSLSMNCCTNIDDVTCVTCGDPNLVRITKLKEAVDIFLNLGSAYINPLDRFGAVVFSGVLDESHSTYTTNTAALNLFLQGIGTNGGTCIGGGLLKGIERMTAQSMPNPSKNLLLFTDGEDNFNPLLNGSVVPATYVAGALPVNPYNPAAPNPPYGTCMPFPASPPVFNTSFKNTSPGIKISTIGFKIPPGPANTLLSNLANNVTGAGGTTNIGMGDPFDFTSFFNQFFAQLFVGSSPQVVKEVKGTTKEGLNSVSFVTNKVLSKITFIMMGSGNDGNSLRFSVKKDTLDVTRLGRIVDKGNYRLWHINFPSRLGSLAQFNLQAGGKWTLETQGRAGVKYMATCIVDDHLLDYKWTFGNPATHAVGNAIPLSLTLKYSGKPVTDSTEVVVMIERTANDGGTALAKAAIPQSLHAAQSAEPGYNNLGQAKHYALILANTDYVKALALTTDKVTLTNKGDGTFTGEYIPKVTGPHKFTILINGKKAAIDSFVRTHIESGVVKLTKFDLSRGNIKVETIKEGSKVISYKLNILVKDSSGLLLGPAFQDVFELKTSSGKFSRVTDNLDGSYSATLDQLGNDTDPQIDISVYGIKLVNNEKISVIIKGKHSCPSWVPGWLASFFESIGINCILGLVITIVLIILVLYFVVRLFR